MPALANSRHELFAHGLVDGKSATQAYLDAGYKDGSAARPGAARLAANQNILRRRDEIIAQERRKLGITADFVARNLLENREHAIRLGQVAAANQADLGIAKLFGLIEQKVTTRHEFAFEHERALSQLEAPRIVDVAPVFTAPNGKRAGEHEQYQELAAREHVMTDDMLAGGDGSATPGGMPLEGGGSHRPGEDESSLPASAPLVDLDPLGR